MDLHPHDTFHRHRHSIFLGRENGVSVLGTHRPALCFGRGHPGVCWGTTSFPTSVATSGMASARILMTIVMGTCSEPTPGYFAVGKGPPRPEDVEKCW